MEKEQVPRKREKKQSASWRRKTRVMVAMSGGVDSSLAAALLKKQGLEVQGVFLKLFDSDSFKKSEKRAKKVAGALGIPFFVLDLRNEFKKKIIDYFIKELQQGKTPNPCVLCNKEIKFGILLKKLRELKIDFDFIATGHYARLRQEIQNCRLFKAKNKEKDQSYFLWQLNQKQLKHILFPIGNYKKEEVRNLAEKFKLPAFSSESQEICFIGKNIDDFLRKNFKIKKGDIVNTEGKIIGKHQGLWFYTIGQRKTIGLSGGPYYVLDKDIRKNVLIVTKNENDLYGKELIVKKVNWISGKEPKLPIKVKAKIRYRHKSAAAIITPTHQFVGVKKNELKVVFDKPQRAITPGQSVVFYLPAEAFLSAVASAKAGAKEGKGQELLGGGIIGS